MGSAGKAANRTKSALPLPLFASLAVQLARTRARLLTSTLMLRQLYDALRFAVADFFDVPWQGVAGLLWSVCCLGAEAYTRTIYGNGSHFGLQALLLVGALIGIYATKSYFKR